MTTQSLVVSVLHSVALDPNSNGDILQFQEVVTENEVTEGDVEREAEYRFTWNDSDENATTFPAGTDLIGLINKAIEADWYK